MVFQWSINLYFHVFLYLPNALPQLNFLSHSSTITQGSFYLIQTPEQAKKKKKKNCLKNIKLPTVIHIDESRSLSEAHISNEIQS